MSLLARLIEAGTPAELVAEVAEELARAKVAQEAIENSRKKARERQARKRERDANECDVTECHVTKRDERDSVAPPLSLPPNEINSNPPTHTPGKQTRARKGGDFPCPDWAEPDVWADLKRNRRQKRLANTGTAHRQFVAKVEEMADDSWPPGEVLREIVARGWGGAHDPRGDRAPKNDNRMQGNSNRNAVELARQKLGQVR